MKRTLMTALVLVAATAATAGNMHFRASAFIHADRIELGDAWAFEHKGRQYVCWGSVQQGASQCHRINKGSLTACIFHAGLPLVECSMGRGVARGS